MLYVKVVGDSQLGGVILGAPAYSQVRLYVFAGRTAAPLASCLVTQKFHCETLRLIQTAKLFCDLIWS